MQTVQNSENTHLLQSHPLHFEGEALRILDVPIGMPSEVVSTHRHLEGCSYQSQVSNTRMRGFIIGGEGRTLRIWVCWVCLVLQEKFCAFDVSAITREVEGCTTNVV
jgi:hypothetical protein